MSDVPPYAKKNTTKTGAIGEMLAARYLEEHGFLIKARNYTKKWGEIDIIAVSVDNKSLSNKTTSCAHIVEVKSVTHETRDLLEYAVTHETWRPEELVHQFKLNQIRKTAETWVREYTWTGTLQIDVIAVRMVPREKFAMINHIENILL